MTTRPSSAAATAATERVVQIVPAAKAAAARAHGATVHAAGETQWWFDCRGADDPALRDEAERSNCTHLLFDVAQLARAATRKQKVAWVAAAGELDACPPDAWVLTPHEELRAAAAARGHKAGRFIQVSDLQAEFPHCVAVCERGDPFVVIDIEHATYIPYELLIAKAEASGTRVLRSVPIRGLEHVVADVDQSLNAFATMEQGVGVLFRCSRPESVRQLSRNLASRQGTHIALYPAEVVEVQHTGLGHRVCVDTTSVMTPEEGMVIGSTGWGGIFVCSETHYLPHMNLREFRVNAGAVHSYIWGKDGMAMYLSEMEAGADVLCASKDGTARVVSVGRAKIERRPMLKVKCRVAAERLPDAIRESIARAAKLGRGVTPAGEQVAGPEDRYVHVNTFLQNDWHVRVMGADGVVRHCTLLQPGDALLAHVDVPGRHTGLRVTEHIVEK
ncbi:MAG: 3-dehydroquinate synthase II [Pseudomonadota bacterium]